MGKKMSHPVPTRRCGYQFMDGVIQRWVVGAPQTPEVCARNCPKHTKENSFGKPSTVQPPIFPTSKTSNHLVIPVFKESRYSRHGKPLWKVLDLLQFPIPRHSANLNSGKCLSKKDQSDKCLEKKGVGKKKRTEGRREGNKQTPFI